MARAALMTEPFEFSEIQANHILDMTLGRLTRLGHTELAAEAEEKRVIIAGLEAILGDDALLRRVIREELVAVRDKSARGRRSELTIDPGEIDIEDLIDDDDLVFTMSAGGYVKTVPVDDFRTQGRGGRGVAGAKLKDEDTVTHLIHTTAHSYLLFFSNRGRVYRLKAHEVPVTSRTARGTAIVNLLPLQVDERIEAVIDTRDYETQRYLFFATARGRVKKTRFNAYDSSLRAGLIAVKLNDDDELVDVIPTNGVHDILLSSRLGQTIRFSENKVRAMGRNAAGVIGLKFKHDGDRVVACDIAREHATLLHVTEGGYGKRTRVDDFPRKGRGGMGVVGIKMTDERRVVVSAIVVDETDEILAVTSKGVLIRMAVADISIQGRAATGVKVMSPDEDDKVVAVALVAPETMIESADAPETMIESLDVSDAAADPPAEPPADD
jgi:DNA gyrase subunit A